MHMNTLFWILNLILGIAVIAGFFFLIYHLVKNAIKHGLIEAYKEIQKLKQ